MFADGKGARLPQTTAKSPVIYEKDFTITKLHKTMTTKKTGGRVKDTVENAKKTIDGSNPTTTAGFLQFDFIDGKDSKNKKKAKTSDEPIMYRCNWTGGGTKRKLATEIMLKLVDFNLDQLARTDADSVLIYDNPAEYAAEMVDELYKRVGDE